MGGSGKLENAEVTIELIIIKHFLKSDNLPSQRVTKLEMVVQYQHWDVSYLLF